MLQVICKIGPLSISTYGAIVAIIAAIASVALIIIACLGGMKRRAISVVFFWTLVLAIVAMIPLVTTVTIYSYGLMLAIAVVVSTLLLAYDAHRSNINADIIFDLVFWAVIGGIVGARMFYVALNYPFFMKHPNEIIMIQNGGLAWQGGLILGSIVVVQFIKLKKLPLSPMLDILVPYLALGQSFGRIGCFLNGCCYGRVFDGGIYFPVHDATLYPTQLYLSVGYLIIFIILNQYKRFSEMPGLVFASYLILASSLRFGVEFFRADHEILFFGLSIFQFVCFGILLFAFGFVYVVLIKHSNTEAM